MDGTSQERAKALRARRCEKRLQAHAMGGWAANPMEAMEMKKKREGQAVGHATTARRHMLHLRNETLVDKLRQYDERNMYLDEIVARRNADLHRASQRIAELEATAGAPLYMIVWDRLRGVLAQLRPRP